MSQGGFFISTVLLSAVLAFTPLRADLIVTAGGNPVQPNEPVCYFQTVNVEFDFEQASKASLALRYADTGGTQWIELASFDSGAGAFEWLPTSEFRSNDVVLQFELTVFSGESSQVFSSTEFALEWFNKEQTHIADMVDVCPGSDVSLPINLVAGGVDIQWRRMGGTEILSNSPTLSIPNASVLDGGWYSCDILSSCDSEFPLVIDSYDVYLNVFAMPDVVRITPDKQLCEGDFLELYCVIDEHSPTSLQWYKKDSPEIILSSKKGLKIPSASAADGGEYVFRAVSDVCDWEYTTTVTVEIIAQPAIGDITVSFPDCGALLSAHPSNVTFLQWYSIREGTIVELEGETKNNLHVASLSSGERYFCIGFSECGTAVESNQVEVNPDNWTPEELVALSKNVEVHEKQTEQLDIGAQWLESFECIDEAILTVEFDRSLVHVSFADNEESLHVVVSERGFVVTGSNWDIAAAMSAMVITGVAPGKTTIHSSLALVHHGGYLTQPQHVAVEVAVVAEQFENPSDYLMELPAELVAVDHGDGSVSIALLNCAEEYENGLLCLFNLAGMKVYESSLSLDAPVHIPATTLRSAGQFFAAYSSGNIQVVKQFFIQ